MSWENQKLLQKQDIPSREEIVIKARAMCPRTRALFILLYLTAGRISEVVKTLKVSDFSRDLIISKETGLEREFFNIRMVNLKNKKRIVKLIPIPVDKDAELILLLQEHFESIPFPNDPVFNITRRRAHQILIKETGYNCHFLRHIRLTHLVVNNDFNEALLVKYAGWTDSRPAKHYMELRWQDIAQKM